ncbi:hypothetical protein GH714_005772 [Hevea brasiliensis]|uniref:RRM domain-containing protein n=1 Tax=Hevea brasiliensis TaxID=3981 RepID=A0A6A6MC10_HEVBR|nr:hypothetical protein GH714_005772 [Hevea brasiliensis]
MATFEALAAVHEHARSVFCRLMGIGRVAEESLKVIAFWMWLDCRGFQNIITMLSSRDDKFLSLVSDEAVAVLSSLQITNSTISPNLMRITLTLAPRFLSPSVILSDKEKVLKGINDICREAYCVLFYGFLKERGFEFGRGGEEETVEEITEWLEPSGEGSSNEKTLFSGVDDNWSPYSAGETERSLPLLPSSSVGSNLNPFAKEWNPITERASEEDRCLFFTFSKGYPLTENKIIDFFTAKYGPCVERVYVHWPCPRRRNRRSALFGKVVFKAFCVAFVILSGKNEAKFKVDGKPLWCKRLNLGA